MISTERVSACYSYTLGNLSHLQAMTQDRSTHLAALSGDLLDEEFRLKVITWLFDLGFKLKLSAKCVQLSAVYFDIFCSKWAKQCGEVVRTVALTCLMVAAKFDESSIVSPVWVVEQSGNAASLTDIFNLEMLILETLDWELDQPTAAELSSLLLEVSAPGQDFSGITQESDEYVCYSLRSLSLHGPTAVAIASICCAFEHYGQTAYRDQWLAIVLRHTALTRESVLSLSASIKTQVKQRFGNSNDSRWSLALSE